MKDTPAQQWLHERRRRGISFVPASQGKIDCYPFVSRCRIATIDSCSNTSNQFLIVRQGKLCYDGKMPNAISAQSNDRADREVSTPGYGASRASAILFGICLVVSACNPSHAAKRTDGLVHASIMKQEFYIPRAYLAFPYTSVGDKSALIQSYFPGDAPVPGDAKELWKKGEWYKNVRVLFSFVPKPSPEHFIEQEVAIYKAFDVVGPEYGLIHQTQPSGYVQDNDDLWIQKMSGNIGSVIACDDEATGPVPQCKNIFLMDHFLFYISYDKHLLPQWKTIQQHVISLFKSFKSPESAIAYFKTATEHSKLQGESP